MSRTVFIHKPTCSLSCFAEDTVKICLASALSSIPATSSNKDVVLVFTVREDVCNKAKERQVTFLDFEKKTSESVKNVKVMTCKVLETTQSVLVL